MNAASSVTTTRTVIITGVSSSSPHSSDTAKAFALAGTTHLALLGPDSQHLDEISSDLVSQFPRLKVLVRSVDISSPESLGVASHMIRSQLGAWDVFIHNSSSHIVSNTSAVATTVRGSDDDIWWASFERNVRSLHFIARHFFPKMKANATFINVLVGNVVVCQDNRESAESASALAGARVVEYLGKENEAAGFKVMNVHMDPDRMKVPAEVASASDTLANFLLWCANEEASFLKGRYVYAHMSIDYYLRRRKEIEADVYSMTVGVRPLRLRV